jgi:nucleotide-binding universal stress UspA family protein
MIKRILVGVAGSPCAEAKIAAAVDLAKRHHAAITALSIVDVDRLRRVGPVPLGAEHYAEHLRENRIERSHEEAEWALQAFAAACSAAHVPFHVERQEGDPLDLLASVWRYQDLCLLGTRGWFDHGIIADPEDALLRLIASGVRPLLAIPEHGRPVRRVLIAYNGSLESAKAMKQFLQLRLWPDMEVHIACIGQPKTGEIPATILEAAADYARAYGYRPTTVTLDDGVAHATLLDYAHATGADLIVLGSSYRRVLLGRRFGRNAINLIKSSDCPLFLSH